MKKSFMRCTLFISCLFFLNMTLCQELRDGQLQNKTFSNPKAPIGNKKLTVPDVVRPILDIWLRDAFVMYGPDGNYYLTGTTASPNRLFPNGTPHCWDYNDGIYLWKSKDMKTWQSLGRIWSFDDHAAEWQLKEKPVKKGHRSINGDPLDSIYRAVWAPEIHYIKSQNKWLIVACLNRGGGSFILESISGKPEGPYRNIPGNTDKPIFKNIDASLFEDDDGTVYVIGHNHFIAKMTRDLSDIAEPFRKIQETPYNPEPYIEGVYMTKYKDKYQLIQTVWSVPQGNGNYTYIKDPDNPLSVYSYDVVVAESNNIYGPYGPRYPAIIEGGHNNLFEDSRGNWWSTTFFNPRGIRGRQYNPACRAAVVPVKWKRGKLMPDSNRARKFYTAREN